MKHILIVDDERGTRESLKAVLGTEYRVTTAESADKAMQVLHTSPIELVFLDILMPGRDGLQCLGDILVAFPDLPVIMVSASPGVRPAIQAIRMGACDYISKPFDVEEIRATAQRVLESVGLRRRVALLEEELAHEFPVNGIVGESPRFRKALGDIRKAAETDATVLVIGESGTGKELFARYLHQASRRHSEPFCAVHCAALPEALMESELFGYEKGAFTGADKRKLGLIDTAGNGTLFLDEVSEMTASTQVKLLRVLEQREFMRLGGTVLIPANARVVAASSRDLRLEAQAGRFRDDLYYRLGVIPIHLPPLRDRLDDLPLLTYYFINFFRRRMHVTTRDVEPRVLDLFRQYAWPGNVRELRNIIERMLVLHGCDECIRANYLPDEFHVAAPARPPSLGNRSLSAAVEHFETDLIRDALRITNGVQTQAARQLGITRRMLKYRMDKLGLLADTPTGPGLPIPPRRPPADSDPDLDDE